MKITNCYYCGSDHYTLYAKENGFQLVKCDICGLLFVEDRPNSTEISQAHKQGIHHGNNSFDVTGAFEPAKIDIYLKVLEDLFKGHLGNKKSWLDIGCGHGEFMVAVQECAPAGLVVRGTEPNARKRESARERGLNVNYFEIEAHDEKYDFISMLNLYSHLPDPITFLGCAKRLLRKDGELILETGDTADLTANDHPRPFYLPDHLSFASEDIVTGILKRLDFEILDIRKYPLMRFNLNKIAKELVKAILPNYQSRIYYYRNIYSEIDMFIRARLKS